MESLVVHAPRRRPTQREKERVVRRLQEACVDERLSPDTFARRLDLAFSARTRFELDRLLADIGEPSRLAFLAMRAVNALSRAACHLAAAWREPRTLRLKLPATAGTKTIGRATDCDLVVAGASVSRHHATIELVDDATWRLCDAGSLNGMRLNGWRVTGPIDVRPGDDLELGGCRFVLDRAR
jgi:hypothetical protein